MEKGLYVYKSPSREASQEAIAKVKIRDTWGLDQRGSKGDVDKKMDVKSILEIALVIFPKCEGKG